MRSLLYNETSGLLRTMHEFEAAKPQVRANHLRMSLLDMDRLVKANDLKPITNPITFQKNNIPTPDGLLSNEIFGITMYDRMNTCAYIDLHEWFMHPLIYKTWCKLDKKIVACVNETKYFSINDKGTHHRRTETYRSCLFL